MKKQILTAGLIIAASLMAVGCGGSTEPATEAMKVAETEDDEEKEEEDKDEKGEDEEDEEPEGTLSLDDYREIISPDDYHDLVDNADKYMGTKVSFSLYHVDHIQDDGTLEGYSGPHIIYYVADKRESKIPRVLPGDVLQVWGEYVDTDEFTLKDGSDTLEVPVIDAEYIELSDESAEATTAAAETTTAAAPSYQTMYVVNCKTDITLRTSPNTAASELAKIPLGASVSMVETAANGFYRVIYNGMDGYALASYLSDTPGSGAPVSVAPNTGASSYTTMYVVNCNEYITLRTQPDTSASEIRKIPLGEPVSYIESASNGFYKISYLGDTGYALASYLSDTPGSGASASAPNYTTMYVVNCKEYITLRTEPDTSASEIRKIPLGAAVSYINSSISAFDKVSVNGFYEISYMGDTGYALASYLSDTPGSGASSNTTMYVVNCNEYITLRTQPDTSAPEIHKIPLGAAVSYLGNASNGFYKVSYLGDTGYALASYLSY